VRCPWVYVSGEGKVEVKKNGYRRRTQVSLFSEGKKKEICEERVGGWEVDLTSTEVKTGTLWLACDLTGERRRSSKEGRNNILHDTPSTGVPKRGKRKGLHQKRRK